MKNHHLLFVLILFSISSCKTVLIYSNDPVVTAQVNEAGDFNISGGINSSEYNTGLHANGTVALTDNIFLSSSYTFFNKGSQVDVFSSNEEHFSGYNFNVMAGWYKPIENDFILELGSGYQYGYNGNIYQSIYTNIWRNKFYIQPGISQKKDLFQWGFGVRIGAMDVMSVKTNDPEYNGIKSGFQGMVMAEPGLNFSLGKTVKFGTQISASIHEFSTLKPWGYIFGGVTTDDISFSLFLTIDINNSKE